MAASGICWAVPPLGECALALDLATSAVMDPQVLTRAELGAPVVRRCAVLRKIGGALLERNHLQAGLLSRWSGGACSSCVSSRAVCKAVNWQSQGLLFALLFRPDLVRMAAESLFRSWLQPC